jgi:hypothetical protein
MSRPPPQPPLLTLPARKKYLRPLSLIQSAALGAAYGVVLRVLISGPKWTNGHNTFAVMTIAFIVLGPIVIGFLTIRQTQAQRPLPVWIWIFLLQTSILRVIQHRCEHSAGG